MTSYVSALGRRMKENELRLLLGVQARQMKGKEGCSPSLPGGRTGGPCAHEECQPPTLSSRSSDLLENDAKMSATTALIRGSGSSARANVAAPAIEPRMVMRKMCPALNIGWCQ